MSNHKIDIVENGTKTLLTGGKYCDRNIDVVVNVPSSGGATPTQFTNILDLTTTIIKKGYRCVSGGYTATVDGVAIVCPVKAGTHRLRVRGKYVFGFLQTSKNTSVTAFYLNFYRANSTPSGSAFSGSTITDATENTSAYGQDEYGDFYTDFTMPSDGYIGFTLKDVSYNYKNGTFKEPIITIDEPIGNGGIVG